MNEKVDIRVHFGNLADLSVYVTGTAAEARDTDSKVTDADKIFYYSFDNISGGLTQMMGQQKCSDFRWKDQYRKIPQCT